MDQYPKKKKNTIHHTQRHILIGIVMFLIGCVTGAASFAFFDIPMGDPDLPMPTPIPYVEIVIALQSIPCGAVIPADAVVLVPFPANFAPMSSTADLNDVVGKIARIDIPKETPILSHTVVDAPNQVARGCELPD